jgi:hypothetical protein
MPFMKSHRSPKLLIALLVFGALLVFSCKKELSNQDELTANIVSSESDAEATTVFNTVFDDVMGADIVKNEGGTIGTGIFAKNTISGLPSDGNTTSRGDSLPSCAAISVTHLNTNLFPVKIVIEFSASGCLCNDGHVRAGKIIMTYTNKLSLPGATATTTFENYWVDSIHVEGTHTITNTSTSITTAQIFAVDINSKLSRPNGNYNEWQSHFVMTQTDAIGYPIQAIQSYAFKIYPGSATGKTKRNDVLTSWRADIIEPLGKRYNCRWISKGIIRIIRQNLATNSPWVGNVNYGTGTCDNRAVLTVNGNVHEITLR